MYKPRKPLLSRFMSKVKRCKNGCWEWQSWKIAKGYGQFHYQGKTVYAHRMAYTLFIGPIPADFHVMHKCDNPGCANPKHLFVGTDQDNMTDKVKKGRQLHGEKVNDHILTEAQVLEIFNSKETQIVLSRIYGVCQSHISNIKNGRNWNRLTAKLS